MKDLRLFVVVMVFAVMSQLPGAAHAQITAENYLKSGAVHAPAKEQPLPDVTDITRLLDTRVPLTERQALFAHIKEQADGGDIASQYFVGTLYRVGDKLQRSPVASDASKAKLYLSSAAAHGHIYAMAKMAELSLDAHDYQAAMDWAQIFNHYAPLVAKNNGALRRYAGELVHSIDQATASADKNDQKTLDDLDAFITVYDVYVRTGLKVNRQIPILKHDASVRVGTIFGRPLTGLADTAGFADFLVSIKPNGSVKEAWLLDGTPDIDVGNTLESAIRDVKVLPSNDTNLRYAWFAYGLNEACSHCPTW